MDELKKEIELIKVRNKKVEADKAWETSFTRRCFIAISTYILVSIVFVIIQTPKPFVSAIIPTIGYLLSTLSLGFVKGKWMKKRRN